MVKRTFLLSFSTVILTLTGQILPAQCIDLSSNDSIPTGLYTYGQACKSRLLNGEIAVVAGSSCEIENCLQDLILSAKAQSSEIRDLEAEVQRFSNNKAHLADRTKDALNDIFMFKGVSASSEAGDVILDEKLKIKSKGSAKYAQQHAEEALELRIITNFLQLASEIGNGSHENSKDFQESLDQLRKLVGESRADNALVLLRGKSTEDLPDLDSHLTSLTENQSHMIAALNAAAAKDSIVNEIQADVHKFNHHSVKIMAFHRIVRTTLCVLSLSPNLIGPAAQGVLFGYVVLSGGSESNKILKEIYMEKRLQSRTLSLTDEIHTVFDSHRLATSTNNKLLAHCAERILAWKLNSTAQAHALLHPQPSGAVADAVAEPARAEDETTNTSAKSKEACVTSNSDNSISKSLY